MNELISIILPIYNVEKYIGNCLESIKQQSYTNLQILCVIDGSPDSSEYICKKFAETDTRFKIITQDNCGCAATRNNALELVEGDYICFIDPDDFISENYIESLYNAINESCADIALATMIRIKKNSKKFRTHFDGIKKYSTPSAIFSSATCPPNYAVVNKMYKTNLIKQNNIRFETGCLWCDDVSFCIKTLLLAKKIVTVEDAIYFYIKRSGSISHSTVTKEMQLQRYRIRSSAIKECIVNNIDIPKDELTVTKIVYSFFKIPILRIRVNIKSGKLIALLFGIVPIFSRKTNA